MTAINATSQEITLTARFDTGQTVTTGPFADLIEALDALAQFQRDYRVHTGDTPGTLVRYAPTSSNPVLVGKWSWETAL